MRRSIIAQMAVMFSASFGAFGNNNPKPVGLDDEEKLERLERFLDKNHEPVLSHGKQKFLINGQVIYAISEKHAIRKFKKKTGFTINTIENVKE